jgi:quinol monooxygenase YgiN
MAVGVIWFPPVDKQGYEAMREKVVPGASERGLQFHAAGDANGRWCIFELWQSRDGLERFMSEVLLPAFEETNSNAMERPEPAHIFEVAFQGP